jgi:O-antigen/teichoic acid export membrane protein
VGLAYGLIQRPAVSDEDLRFVFTWQIILGIAMTLILWRLAPTVASLGGDPRLETVVALLAPSCLINSAAAASGAMLRRQLDFRALNIAAVVSYGVGFFLFAIPMALAGLGVYALVAGFMIQATVMAAMQYRAVRHPVKPLFWQTAAPDILGFGATVLATNLVNWAMSSIDRAIAGSAIGTAAAGVYATASNLIMTPMTTLLALMQSVFYAASARVQDDQAQLARGMQTLFAVVLLFVAPVFAGVAGSAETLFVTLYGAKWAGGGDVLAPLALAMPAYLLMGLATPALWNSGAIRKEFLLQLPIAAVWIVVLYLVAQAGSIVLLSWCVLGLVLLRAGVIITATVAAVGLPFRALLSACSGGLVVTAVVGAVSVATDSALVPMLGHTPATALLDILACGLALLLATRVVAGWIDDDVLRLMSSLTSRVPGGPRLLATVIGRPTA